MTTLYEQPGLRSHLSHDPNPDVHRLITLGDLTAITVACRHCGEMTDSVDFQDQGQRPPSFLGLPTEVRAAVMARRENPAEPGDVICPRCRLIETVPWHRVEWSNLTPSDAGGSLPMQIAVNARQNRCDAPTPIIDGAIFDPGRIALLIDVNRLFGEPEQSMMATRLQDWNPASSASRLFARHVSGDFGLRSSFDARLAADPLQGMLASRLVRNVRAVQSGRGDVLSHYRVGEPIATVWTVFGAAGQSPLTAIFVNRTWK